MVTPVRVVHGGLRPGVVRLGGNVMEVSQDLEVSQGLRGNHGSVASSGVDVVDVDKAVTAVHCWEPIAARGIANHCVQLYVK